MRTIEALQRDDGAEEVDVGCRDDGRERLRLGREAVLHALLHEDRERHGRDGERQHAVAEHRIDEEPLEARPKIRRNASRPNRIPTQNGSPDMMAASMKKAGGMTNSPCAKLMVCDVCQSSVKPIADERVDRARGKACDERDEFDICEVPVGSRRRTGPRVAVGLVPCCSGLSSFGQDRLRRPACRSHLDEEALAVDVALLVLGGLHEDARLLRGLDRHAREALGKFL